jgi:hypothetical protein
MRARCAAMRDAGANHIWDAARATLAGKRLVYVCDGHPRSDVALYGRAKFAAGEMTAKEFLWHQAELEDELNHPELALFRSPDMFVELYLAGDTDGTRHHHRVFTLRQTETERNVPPSEYKRLAQFASNAHEHIHYECPNTIHAKLNTWEQEPTAVWASFVTTLGLIESLTADQTDQEPTQSTGPILAQV